MWAVNARMLSSKIAVAWIACVLASAAHGNDGPVSFRQHIAPLLQRRCVGCHGEDSAKGGYRLDSFTRLSKSGESELPPLVAGQAKESELYRLLVETNAPDRMPQKAEPLPAHEIALVERWIAQGAINDGGPPERPLTELVRETLLRPAPEKYARPVPVTALAFSPDGTQLAASGHYAVTLWDVETGALVRRIGGLPERIAALAWDRQTKLLAVAGGSPAQWGTVALVDPLKDAPPRFLCDLPEMALAVAFSPGGASLAAGSGDRTIRFFNVQTGKQTRLLRPQADWVQSVAFNAEGTRLLSASRDRTARIFNTATGELEASYTGHDTPALTAIFSRDGRTAVSTGLGKEAHFWNADDARTTHKPLPLPACAARLAVVASGLITGGSDGLVRLHQTTDQQVLFTLHGHGDAVTSLAVSPSGGTLASGSYDGTVCVWNFACGTWSQRFTASPR